uniref:Uncharacterized protein n=1 Tax=Ditylenchus dipsaci TaxID=166011 RepID=A0A915DA44_9BILA
MRHLNEHNNKYFKALNLPLQLKSEPESAQKNVFVEEAEELVKTYFRVDSVSILSPRLFSLYPPKSGTSSGANASVNTLLSPSLLSFNQNDGFLTLPSLFKLISNNNNEVLEWLELLMEISGAGQSLDKLLIKLEPKMVDLEKRLVPAVTQAQKLENNYLDGYAMLSSEQQSLIYGNAQPKSLATEQHIEDLIFNMADLGRHSTRYRRQLEPVPPNVDIKGPEDIDEDDVGYIYVLQPWAFANRVGLGVIIEGLILSPHAFVTEIMAPELLTADVISPRAFIPTILTPQVLIARILSPSAFRAEVLSPEFLSIYTLTPRQCWLKSCLLSS